MKNCLSLAKSSEFVIDQCVICQKKSKVLLRSTENATKNIIDAAAIRKDEVYQRLQNCKINRNFKYHVTNSFFKNYAMKKTLESLSLFLCKFDAINCHFCIVYIFTIG